MATGGQAPPSSMTTASDECSGSIRMLPTGGGQNPADSVSLSSDEDCKYCSLCSETGHRTHATKYCVDCSKYLCVTCLTYHSRFPTTSYHQVIDVEDHAPIDQGTQLACLPSERCPEHRVQLIDTYCQTHDVVCCGTCVALYHKTKSCNIKYIAEAAVGIKTSQEVDDVKQDLLSSYRALQQKKKVQQEAIRKINQEQCDAKRAITNYRQQIKQHFDDLEKEALDQVDEKHKAAVDKLTANKGLLDNSIIEIEKNKDQIQNFTSNNEVQLFSYIKIAKKNVTHGNTILQTIEANKTNLSFNFKKEENITASIPALGEVENVSSDDAETVFVQLESHYPIDKETDTLACHVLSSCTLQNGQTLMTDRSNLKLKQFNEAFQFVEECELPEFPWGVCETEAGQAALILPVMRRVQFVSTRHSLTLTSSFRTEPPTDWPRYHCRGIAYHNGKLFISCIAIQREINAEIRVYDMSGVFLEVLSDKTLKRYLNYPTNLTVSRDGERIIIADLTRGLIIVDKRGNTISTIELEHLHGGFGVCLGDNNQVFACGYGSSNVIQFNTDGGAVRQLMALPDDGPKPMSVCFNGTTNTLAVTRSHCDFVSAFQLEKKNIQG